MSKRVLHLFQGILQQQENLAEHSGFSPELLKTLRPHLVENRFIDENGCLRSKGRNFLELLEHQELMIQKQRQEHQNQVHTAILFVEKGSTARLRINKDQTVLAHNVQVFKQLGFEEIYVVTNDKHLYQSKDYRLITMDKSRSLVKQFGAWLQQAAIDKFIVIDGSRLFESRLIDLLNQTDRFPLAGRNRENGHLLAVLKANQTFFNHTGKAETLLEAITFGIDAKEQVICLSPRSIRGVSKKNVKKRYQKILKREAQYNQIKAKVLVSQVTSRKEVEAIKQLGGLTNQNFHLEVQDKQVVARIPGAFTQEFINRRYEDENSTLMSLLGINTAHIYFNRDDGSKVNGYISNPLTYSPKVLEKEYYLEKSAQLLKKLHSSGLVFVNDFDWQKELTSYEQIVLKHEVKLPKDYEETKARVQKLYATLKDQTKVACHCDALCENFVIDKKTGRLFLVDWEYSGNNHPAWDLASLMVESQMSKKHQAAFLKAYGDIEVRDVRICMVIQDFIWSIWGLMKHAQRMDFYDYFELRYTRAKKNLRKLEEESHEDSTC